MNVKPPFNVTAGAEAAGVAALKDTKWIKKNIKHNNIWSLQIYKKLKEKKINLTNLVMLTMFLKNLLNQKLF